MSPRILSPCLSSPNWVSIQVQDAGRMPSRSLAYGSKWEADCKGAASSLDSSRGDHNPSAHRQ